MTPPIDTAKLRELLAKATPIDGAPGYLVTADGRVWSTSNWRGYGYRELKPYPNSHGYPRVHLRRADGGRWTPCVHAIVARAFLAPRPSPAHEVRHLDGTRTNSAAANLAWGTRKENAADRECHGRTARGARNAAHVLPIDAVRKIKSVARIGRGHGAPSNIKLLAKTFGVSTNTIRSIVKGTWRKTG